MRLRVSATIMAVIAVLMTTTFGLAAMRVNATFSAFGTTSLDRSSNTTLMSLTVSETSNVVNNNKGGLVARGNNKTSVLCEAPCSGLFLSATGTFYGIGPTDALVNVVAVGVPTVTCTNQGGTKAPGNNPVQVSVIGDSVLGAGDVAKNGTAPLNVTTDALGTWEFPGSQLGCPNDNWTATIESIRFTSATINVTQDGVTTLNETFELDQS